MFRKTFGKINWILKVFPLEKGQTKHKIDSVMQIYPAIFDKIQIKKSKQFEVKYLFQGKTPMEVEDCSITKIINWLKINYPNINTNYKIIVKKYIPIGSGFGGESSDAGFVLNKILKINKQPELNDKQLYDIAINVGSDIPFFYKKLFIAHVNEYGNRVVRLKYSIPFNPDIYPSNYQTSTKKIYEMLDNNYESNVVDVKKLYEELIRGIINKNTIYNDLQKYVFKLNNNIEKDYNELDKNPKAKLFINGAGSNIVIVKD